MQFSPSPLKPLMHTYAWQPSDTATLANGGDCFDQKPPIGRGLWPDRYDTFGLPLAIIGNR